jgi:hypothetical protein
MAHPARAADPAELSRAACALRLQAALRTFGQHNNECITHIRLGQAA